VKVLGKENSFAAVKFIKKQDGVAKSYFKELEAFLCLLKSGQKGSFKRFATLSNYISTSASS
jgi:hypothetical protein